MELTLTPNGILEVISDNTRIKEDIVYKGEIDENIIENLITTLFEMTRFNKKSDVQTVFDIFDAFLNKEEREEFKQMI